MDESSIKGLGLNDRVIRSYRTRSRICVEGYDSSLHKYALKLALTKHFASCGEIIRIYVPKNYEKGILESLPYISFAEEGAQEKALQLSGTDVGGWTVFPKALPSQGAEDIVYPDGVDRYSSERMMFVTGYDTSLPKIDLQIGLTKHFSSCGEVTDVVLLKRNAFIKIMGEGAVDKALELSECDVGGWNIRVVSVFPPPGRKTKFPTGNRRPSRPNKLRRLNNKIVKEKAAPLSFTLLEEEEEEGCDYGVEFSLLGED